MDRESYAEYIHHYDKFSSYSLASSSTVVVSIASTLAYEFFGSGKKVLFLGSGSLELEKKEGTKKNFSKLPKNVSLKCLNEECIKDKLLKLICEPQDEYLLNTKDARMYYMNYGKEYAHNVIKNRIAKFINNHD